MDRRVSAVHAGLWTHAAAAAAAGLGRKRFFLKKEAKTFIDLKAKPSFQHALFAQSLLD
jgi:hypothetical protein